MSVSFFLGFLPPEPGGGQLGKSPCPACDQDGLLVSRPVSCLGNVENATPLKCDDDSR